MHLFDLLIVSSISELNGYKDVPEISNIAGLPQGTVFKVATCISFWLKNTKNTWVFRVIIICILRFNKSLNQNKSLESNQIMQVKQGFSKTALPKKRFKPTKNKLFSNMNQSDYYTKLLLYSFKLTLEFIFISYLLQNVCVFSQFA